MAAFLISQVGSGVLSPLGDPALGFVKVLRDLTDRKRMEDEREEEHHGSFVE